MNADAKRINEHLAAETEGDRSPFVEPTANLALTFDEVVWILDVLRLKGQAMARGEGPARAELMMDDKRINAQCMNKLVKVLQ